MKTTVDRFGRMVVPKEIRDRLGVRPGAEIEIEEREGEIVLRQVEYKVPLKKEDGVLVFTGTAMGDISESVRGHREERLKKFSMQRKA